MTSNARHALHSASAFNAVKRVGRNLAGRDFIVGDIHACFDLVWQGLLQAGFQRDRDRLFCVGDTVDRGPTPLRVERFLEQPWVHVVRGNHECMLIEMYANGEPHPDVMRAYMNAFGARNGMLWWLDVASDQRLRIVEAFRRLPYVIELETARGLVGIVHAEVPAGMDWKTFIARVECGDDATLRIATEGRDRVTAEDDAGVPGIDRVFVGHTPQLKARRLGNVYYIDTGAFLNVVGGRQERHLTIADVCANAEMFNATPCPGGPVSLLLEAAESGQSFETDAGSE